MIHYLSFLHGAIAMGNFIAGLFFLRYWTKTGDRLFMLFSIAFWMLACEYIVFLTVVSVEENKPAVYLIRLTAFFFIFLAIVDRNRARKS